MYLENSCLTWLFVHFDFHHISYFPWTLTGGIHIMRIQVARWWQMQRVGSRHIKNIVFLDTFPVIGHISTWNKSTDTSKCNKSHPNLLALSFPRLTSPVLCPTQIIPLHVTILSQNCIFLLTPSVPSHLDWW